MKSRVLRKLAVLNELVEDDRTDEVVEDALNYLLSYERTKLEGELALTREEIAQWESHFDMPSGDFLRRYEAGVIEDTGGSLEWFALLSLEVGLAKKIELISHALALGPAGALA